MGKFSHYLTKKRRYNGGFFPSYYFSYEALKRAFAELSYILDRVFTEDVQEISPVSLNLKRSPLKVNGVFG